MLKLACKKRCQNIYWRLSIVTYKFIYVHLHLNFRSLQLVYLRHIWYAYLLSLSNVCMLDLTNFFFLILKLWLSFPCRGNWNFWVALRRSCKALLEDHQLFSLVYNISCGSLNPQIFVKKVCFNQLSYVPIDIFVLDLILLVLYYFDIW